MKQDFLVALGIACFCGLFIWALTGNLKAGFFIMVAFMVARALDALLWRLCQPRVK